MANLGPTATVEQLGEEIDFLDVLIETLDPGADDYASQADMYQQQRQDLQQRLDTLSGQQSGAGVNGAPERTIFRQRDFSGEHGGIASGLKRPLPYGDRLDADQHRSKRYTPDVSNAGTPVSSDGSFELQNHGDHLDRARMRQLEAEAAFRRRREEDEADREMARRLSEHQPHSRPSSSVASSSRPSVQTTLGLNGSYQRPPPASRAEPLPEIKAEAETPQSRQLAQRPRPSTGVVDLTAFDDDSEGEIAEIAPSSFTPNRRPPPAATARGPTPSHSSAWPRNHGVPPPYQMPGSFPANQQTQPTYGRLDPAIERMRQQYRSIPGPQSAMQSAIDGIRYAASSVSGQLGELNGLINGSSANPFSINDDDDDDDVVYGGYHQRRVPGLDPIDLYSGREDSFRDRFDPYAGREELYRNRFDALAAYDPAQTKEEINALLQNIRPDEEMPAHLRVQTPESMAVKLHKYQELGLTWLKNCEEGTNKGGILADDMGLGKTIQMLSLLVSHPSQDPRCKTTLVVAPVALMRQWKQEIQTRIKPGPRHQLTVYTHHGQSKKKQFAELQHYDVVITTYGSIASELKKVQAFQLRKHNDPNARPYPQERCALLGEDAKWYRVILDEAQCIKNRGTQTAKGAYLLNAKYRFCMTGTPMMNNVDELYSLVHFLRIKPYDKWEKFRMDFSTPLKSAWPEAKEKAMKMLQTLCKAVMLRRTKTSKFEGVPILVLPERVNGVANPEFSEDETQFYQALESRTALQFSKYMRAGTVGRSYTAILVLLLRLRQACCHPHLIKDFGVSATTDVTPDKMVEFAESLIPQVVARIKDKDGNFECPVCYDASTNPAIFIPCGHDTCSDCFARLTDPGAAVAEGNENGGKGKCPECRGEIDSKKVTDFHNFKRVHQRELLTAEELGQMEGTASETEDDEGDDSSTEENSDTEEDDDVDQRGNLRGFIVNDEVDEGEEEQHEAGKEDEEGHAGPLAGNGARSRRSKKSKGSKKSKKAKGKEKKKGAKALTLAELKKLSTKSKAARKKYLRRLNKDWVSSAKIESTLEILRKVMTVEEGEKVLIFSQWTSLLDLLEIPIDREGWGYVRYDGSMNPRMRGDAVDDFRDHRKDVRIMLVSLKAGNAGLNLNMASQVIILDPFWNPYIEEQAIDRAHRLGQTRPVNVHRVLIPDTVEDRIVALQEKKRALISEALDEKASQNIARLGVQELAYLFGVTNNPNQAVQYTPRERRR